jgi:hypothetical protein
MFTNMVVVESFQFGNRTLDPSTLSFPWLSIELNIVAIVIEHSNEGHLPYTMLLHLLN